MIPNRSPSHLPTEPDWIPHISASDDESPIAKLERPPLSAFGPDDPVASLTFNFSITVLGLGVSVPLVYAFPRAIQRQKAELALDYRTNNRFMFRGSKILYENFVVSYDTDQSVYPPHSVLLPATQKRAIPLIAVPRRYNGRNEYFSESRDGTTFWAVSDFRPGSPVVVLPRGTEFPAIEVFLLAIQR